jgi:hypothetical protein
MALLCRLVLDSTDSCRRGKGCCAIDPLASQEVAKLREEHLEKLGALRRTHDARAAEDARRRGAELSDLEERARKQREADRVG